MLFKKHEIIVRSEGDQIIKNVNSKEKHLKSWQSVVIKNIERSNKLAKVLANYSVIFSKPNKSIARLYRYM